MDFEYSDKVNELRRKLQAFMDAYVIPNRETFEQQIAESGDPHFYPPILEELKAKARAEGLWNLFLPDDEYGAGLTNLEYAPLAEIMGRVEWSSEIFNCNAPDTGNMEIFAQFGTEEQKKQWLEPLLEGKIRSGYAMTEPGVSSSDPINLQFTIKREGDEYVLNGRKWWTTGASRERCQIFIVMGLTNPDNPIKHQRHTMVLVPRNTPGLTVLRNLSVMGYTHNDGHAELVFENVRVPVSNRLGDENAAFAISQARLGPGRIHHCMRSIGAASFALELMIKRATERSTYGSRLAEHGVIQNYIAESAIEIEQARLLTFKAAWTMDTIGKKAAMNQIAMIKVVAPRVHTNVVNRAIQVYGGEGISQDTPLAHMWATGRMMHLVDGPDEVHIRALARSLIKQASLAKAE
ncbi:MAG: acyl-CoA dehydrogenase family protein [Chloroflexi bacterium]|uniref:Acyl-CoA dehydrogenase family protein n=1 Tax=Candidatus Chlorohelix allophototropha TaxID=3003348 RepID=A0A8T7LW09_9CHLR|nr:acyl-CoA dehydrogenase family protein [Chloroflexota bacterium]WJW65561.1 acyl-CoA dehydrogenase family protein [Chloroflexota bacterium L227-S17]